MIQLSIIIVNYKSTRLVCDCLQSVYEQNAGFSFEIIVVDNHSEDGSKEEITSSFPEVIWMQMGYNSGFARANNEGIRNAEGEIVLLLNSDTIIENNAIEICYNKFDSSDFVACGVQLLNADRTPQISGNYIMKGGLNYLLPLPYLGHILKNAGGLFGVKKPHVPEASGVVEVDWINGAFLMVKKIAIQKAGLLDEDFFLYAEDSEWCSRLKKEGELCIYGDINVIHLQGETSEEVFESSEKGYKHLFDKKGLQIMLSTFVRIRKEFGVGWFILILSVYVLEILLFFIGMLLSKLFLSGKYSFSDVQHYAGNIFKIVKFVPAIIKDKPYFYKVL